LPAGVRREIFDREFEEKGRQTVMARLVVERHPEGVHCCAIDHPGMRNSVKARITEIANQLRSELFPHDKAMRMLFWRLVPPPSAIPSFFIRTRRSEPKFCFDLYIR
jgi:hypothetical protein